MNTLKRAFLLLFWMTLLTGLIYPLLVTSIAQLAMPVQANGSIIFINGRAIGSKLIGQNFESEKYFWGRPSSQDYNGLLSGGSNLGPTSPKLKNLVIERKTHLLEVNNKGSSDKVPTELLFASGSGLDPHISLEAALFQKSRIVKARKGDAAFDKKLSDLITSMVTQRKFGFIGLPCLNVLELNLALDELQEKS